MQKNMIKSEELLDLLNKAAEKIFDAEYSLWNNTNTTINFNDWFSDTYEEKLYNRLKDAANQLEDQL